MYKFLAMCLLIAIGTGVALLFTLSQGAATLALGVLIGGGMCTSAVAMTLASSRRNNAYEAHQRHLDKGGSGTGRIIEYHDNRTVHLHMSGEAINQRGDSGDTMRIPIGRGFTVADPGRLESKSYSGDTMRTTLNGN